jgi:hypothetical protein
VDFKVYVQKALFHRFKPSLHRLFENQEIESIDAYSGDIGRFSEIFSSNKL